MPPAGLFLFFSFFLLFCTGLGTRPHWIARAGLACFPTTASSALDLRHTNRFYFVLFLSQGLIYPSLALNSLLAKDDLELLILQAHPKCWDYKYAKVPPHQSLLESAEA